MFGSAISLSKTRPYAHFREDTPAADVVRCIATADWQDAFPVLSVDGRVVGVITAEVPKSQVLLGLRSLTT